MSFRCVRPTQVPLRLVGVAALVATSVQCAQLIGLDEFFDCPGDVRCPAPDGGTPPAPTCTDGVKNGNESDKDCGGSCPACAIGRGCETGADCASQVCGSGRTCLGPGCADQLENGDETDVDCGGTCSACAPGKACKGDLDCTTKSCVAGKCVPTCTDGLKDGPETDVDCGGGAASGCPACEVGGGCTAGADCGSGICQSTKCVDYHVWSKSASALKRPVIAMDGSGGIILGATLTGTVDLGGGPLVQAGGGDLVVARFDGQGNHLWSKRFGDAKAQSIGAVATDGTSQIAIAGAYEGDPGFVPVVPGAPGGNAFFAVFDMQGKFLRWKGVANSTSAHESRGVWIDGFGDVGMAGWYSGTPDFGGGPQPGGQGVFCAGYGSNGQHQYSVGYVPTSSDGARANAMAAINGVWLLTGYYFGTIDFGHGLLPDTTGGKVFVTKIGPQGWSRGFVTGDDYSTGNGVAVDPNGNVIAAGVAAPPVDFGGGPRDGGAFVVKFDPSGNHLWSKTFGPPPASDASASAVAVDSAGNIVVTGSFNNTIDCGGGPLVSAGGYDVFVAKFDPQGNHLWSRRFGDPQPQAGTTVGVISSTEIVVAGNFGGLVDFGGGMLASQSPDDLFLARYRTP